MNTKPYELVLMVDPTFSEQARKECIDTCLALLVGHSIIATDDMGMIKTVYPFGGDKKKTHVYTLSLHIMLDPSTIVSARKAMRYIAGLARYYFFSMHADEAFAVYKDITARVEKLLSTSADGTIARKKSNILNTKEGYALLHRKAVGLLRSYMTRFDNIKPRKFTGHSVRLQKKLRQTIIRSRELGMTPYTH